MRAHAVYGQIWRAVHDGMAEDFGSLPTAQLYRPPSAPYKIVVVNGTALFPWRYAHDMVTDLEHPVRLTQARLLAGMAKQALATSLDVSPAAIGQFEAGVSKPRPDHLPKLAFTLRIPVSFFAAGRPHARVDAGVAHFRSLRSTRVAERAKALAYVEQVWELVNALDRHVELPEPRLPSTREPARRSRFHEHQVRWHATSFGAVQAVGVDLERNSDAVAGPVATSVGGTPALSRSDPAACRSRRIGGPGVGLLEFHSDYVQGPRSTESPTRYVGGLPCSAWTLMLLKISAFTVCDGLAKPCG